MYCGVEVSKGGRGSKETVEPPEGPNIALWNTANFFVNVSAYTESIMNQQKIHCL
jgi:hypothetical protein